MRLASASLLATLFFAASARPGDPGPEKISFDKAKVGELPAGWKSGVTGKADGSVWKVAEDKTAPGGSTKVLAQTTTNASPIFNLCVLEEGKYKDVDVSIAFKAIDGKIDQGGGVAWRMKDKDNYYVVRFNPLEDNFRLYKVVDGNRLKLVYVDKGVNLEPGKWHTIRVVHKGNKIQCFLDGKMVIETTDDEFTAAGKIALWTKSDAVTCFREIVITAKKE